MLFTNWEIKTQIVVIQCYRNSIITGPTVLQNTNTDKHGCVLQALFDFKHRIMNYEKVYESMTDGTSNRDMHFIQLVNMVTGRGHMDINRISGYIPGKIVFFLMQVIALSLIQFL